MSLAGNAGGASLREQPRWLSLRDYLRLNLGNFFGLYRIPILGT